MLTINQLLFRRLGAVWGLGLWHCQNTGRIGITVTVVIYEPFDGTIRQD